ncbi:hypothetical protein JHK87_040766 [Glycine soja]|nr:hypothetical protein JHK87_040766 [Glycine soja]
MQHEQVGEDEFGYMLANILKENNVNNEGMRFDPGARTALAFVTLRSDGEREFMFYRNPSADMLLQEDELDLDPIRKAKIFHYGSISLITEPCKSAHIAAAKDAGVVLSYDPNLRLPLWPSADSAREGILSIWETADIIKEFCGRVKGLKVDAVDTTGAGDAFVAGILSQLAVDLSILQKEDELRDSLKFANVCGALTVTERCAIPALPTKEAVLNAMLAQETLSLSYTLSIHHTMAEDPQDVADRERIFKRFDANGDGQISSAELGEALKALGSVTAEEVKRMMEEIDTDGDGYISYQEFTEFAKANRGLVKDVAKIF